LTIIRHGGRCPDLLGPASALRKRHGIKKDTSMPMLLTMDTYFALSKCQDLFKELQCYNSTNMITRSDQIIVEGSQRISCGQIMTNINPTTSSTMKGMEPIMMSFKLIPGGATDFII
jgi:hypothetical protein